jgi:diguanylate cyclase (GGDEF)-like protein/PAS domain S-box-containing protein
MSGIDMGSGRLFGLPVAGRLLVLAAAAAVFTAIYLVLPPSPGAEVLQVVAPALGAGAVFVGLATHRPARVLPWVLLATSLVVLAASHLVWATIHFRGDDTFPSLADLLNAIALLILIGALVLLIREDAPDHDTVGVLETAIFSIAAVSIVWLVVVEPHLGDSDRTASEIVWGSLVPLLGAIAFALAVRFAIQTRVGHAAPVVLAIGTGLLAVEMIVHSLRELGDGLSPGGPAAALGVVAPLAVSMAALDPTMAPRNRVPEVGAALDAGRTIWLSVAVLTPVTILLSLVLADLGSRTTRIVLAVAGIAVIVLALARMWGLVAAVRHLTERRGQDRLAAMVEHSSDVVMLVDGTGHIKYASPGLTGTLGHRVDDWLGRPVVDLIAEEDREAAATELARLVAGGPDHTVQFESSLVRVDGVRRRMEATLANLIGGDAVDGVVATFRDVTEQRNLERQLSHRAFHDELTGLANRALFLDRMDHALRVSRPDSDPVVVLFVDLDDFKAVNDALGHGVGDQLLRAIANRIRSTAGSGDTPARLGGDEFALLLEDRGGVDRALDVAGRLLDELREPVQLAGYDIAVLASVGVAVAAPGMTTSSLLRDADIAMYEAKRAGKGQIKIFDPAMRLGATKHLEYRTELAAALELDQLRVVYQPLVDLATGNVTGAEALVRWRHPVRGEVSPGEFIPVAERAGLIGPIGAWVLDRAVSEAVRWQTRGRRHVSVNVSPVQLREDGFVDEVDRVLARHGLDPDRLTLEVTETVLVEEIETASDTLTQLRGLGVRIAIDDFGTGYCSLSYLQRFPVDVLKIDRQFIAEVGDDVRGSSLARMILQMATALEVESVAEGIERPEQLAALRRLGCTTGQGFLLSRPLEVDDVNRRFGVTGRPALADSSPHA